MYKTITEYLDYNSTKKENFVQSEKLKLTSVAHEYSTTTDPKVWGPPFWFTLHVSAAHYPEEPSSLVKEKIKNRILAIPFELPCVDCRTHANNYIQSRAHELDSIVSSRQNLFKFYVDFHNKVNERHNKPIMSVNDAYKLYSNGVKVVNIKYN